MTKVKLNEPTGNEKKAAGCLSLIYGVILVAIIVYSIYVLATI